MAFEDVFGELFLQAQVSINYLLLYVSSVRNPLPFVETHRISEKEISETFPHKVYFCLWYPGYGVATISRLLNNIGLFCKKALSTRRYSVKETYNFKELTNRSHPIWKTEISETFPLFDVWDCWSEINWIEIGGFDWKTLHSTCNKRNRIFKRALLHRRYSVKETYYFKVFWKTPHMQ